jgi:hypothetical protein
MYQLLCAILLVGGLFALIALMPEFDGWREGDWEPGDPRDDGRKRGQDGAADVRGRSRGR